MSTVPNCNLRFMPDNEQTEVVRLRLTIIWPCKNHLARDHESGEEEELEVHRRRGGEDNVKERTGPEFSNLTPRGMCRTGKDGESWLHSRQWCPNDPYGLRESEVKK